MPSNLNSAFANDKLVLTTRIFGWIILALLAAFIINVILGIYFGWPLGKIDTNQPGKAIAQIVLYLIAVILSIIYVFKTPDITLRADGTAISHFNRFIVRAAFWITFYIGLADAIVSFLRVEDLLAAIVGDNLTKELGRPQFRGLFLHTPLLLLGILTAMRTKTLGFQWFALLIVVAELLIVICRFVFSYEQAFMGDLVRFWYAPLFLFSSAYTLLQEGHVRVDVFYTRFSDSRKGALNAIGTILLGITLCWTILIIGLADSNAIIASPLANFEISQSGFGMYVKYLLAGFLAVFAISMLIEFVNYLFQSVADYRNQAGKQPLTNNIAH